MKWGFLFHEHLDGLLTHLDDVDAGGDAEAQGLGAGGANEVADGLALDVGDNHALTGCSGDKESTFLNKNHRFAERLCNRGNRCGVCGAEDERLGLLPGVAEEI